MDACSAPAGKLCGVTSANESGLLTLGYPRNIEVCFGNVSYGAEAPHGAGEVEGLKFRICGTVPGNEAFLAYGLRRGDGGLPQVWRARTKDGLVFTDAEMLFEAPLASTPWLAGDVAMKGSTLFLLQTQLGTPPTKGHPFHLFSGPLEGGEWRKLSAAPVYLGQDSFDLVWHTGLGRFVNYQTSYQRWDKRFDDNMPSVRRVLHIRTSPDCLEWTPGGSFGVEGPHLPQEQLIVPDETDTPDTEFYHLSSVNLGEFWAGIMVKYVSQPSLLPKCNPFPHGPLLGYEWWISEDGMNWDRPYRETSSLEGTRNAFAYNLYQPIIVGDELRWPISQQVYGLDRRRMFYVLSHANAELTTREFALSGQPISVEMSFESNRRNADPFLRQGYLMAELLDGKGETLAGFEGDKCVFTPGPETRLTLKWGDRFLPERSTGSYRLRLIFRDVRLFSVTH